MTETAIVLANGQLAGIHAKTAHGLVRGTSRFRILGVIDPEQAGRDAGEVVDGAPCGIPVFASIAAALAALGPVPRFCIVGVASHGGKLTAEMRALVKEAVRGGMSVVNGMHEFAGDDPEIAALARAAGVDVIDVRRPKPKEQLHFWTGAVKSARAPRVAVLGMDCAIGKRTTAKWLVDALNARGVRAEMIYTGQTGWMQGAAYGFVLDSTVNDFISGELEHAIVSCDRERAPDVIVIEGQSGLRNPCGPCGAEILLSGDVHGVVLQHAPGRRYFEGYEHLRCEIGSVADEIRLIALLGARTLAVTLHSQGLDGKQLAAAARALQDELGLPVIDPRGAIDDLAALVADHARQERRQREEP